MVVSHWSNVDMDRGHIPVEMLLGGMRPAYDEFEKLQIDAGGSLPYSSAYPTSTSVSGVYLLHVIEREPILRLK